MRFENIMQWTTRKLSHFTSGDVPVTRSASLETLRNGRASAPSLDLFENESEFLLVVDVPGASPTNTHLSWNDLDTLFVHVQRCAPAPGTLARCEYEEADWYREVVFSPDADGTNAHSTVRDGVLTVRIPKRRTVSSTPIPVYAA